jgi:hypothetical protein
MEKSIFSKLPLDVIKYILVSFDERFILRNGNLVSIILKSDYRYKILETITIKPEKPPREYYNYLGNDYIFNHKYNFFYHHSEKSLERIKQYINLDSINVNITIHKNGIVQYFISIYRLKPKINSLHNKQIFYKGNLTQEYDWNMLMYSYIRK